MLAQLAPVLTARLAALARAMSHPSFELCSDEAAAVVSIVADAIAGGFQFDPFTLALVGVLRRQIADATGDTREDDDPAGSTDELPDWDEVEAGGEFLLSNGIGAKYRRHRGYITQGVNHVG